MIGTFLTGCNTCPLDHDLIWLNPIEFSQPTKEWLLGHSPWPDYVREDFNKIAILNDTVRAIRNLD